MMRQSFRIGLRLGLLGGIAAAVAKAAQMRRNAHHSDGDTGLAPAWPPFEEQRTMAEPVTPPLRTEDETPAPIRKSAAKKAPAAKAARPAKKAAQKAAKKAAGAAWVEPTGSVCPPSHPVKAKLSSKLFHLPGMFAYARTVPDRCYRSEAAAEADGLRKAKR